MKTPSILKDQKETELEEANIEIEVHKNCNGLVHGVGEDGISYCEDCETIVEGDTEYITIQELEEREN